MRNISFSKTTQQVREARKWVTRRYGTWESLEPGTLLMGVKQAMGLPKGATVERIRPIRVTDVRLESLDAMDCGHTASAALRWRCYGCTEALLEGFPEMGGSGFVNRFASGFGCGRRAIVTRIAFEYADEQLLHRDFDGDPEPFLRSKGLTPASEVRRPRSVPLWIEVEPL